MNINEILSMDNLTEEQLKFKELHNKILYSGRLFTDFVWLLGNCLKKMKDEELFKVAGFDSFSDYTVNAIGLKERQAYNYIRVVETYSEEFLHLNAKMGVTKLLALSTLTSEEQDVLIEKVDVDSVSIKELNETISKLKQENLEKEGLINSLNNKIENNLEIKKLKSKIKDLSNKPVKVEYVKDEKVVKELSEVKADLKIKEEKIKELQKGNLILSKQQVINSSEELIQFKIKFEDLQNIIKELNILISKIPLEKQENCKNALKAVVNKLC